MQIYASFDVQFDACTINSGYITAEVWKGFSVVFMDTSVTTTKQMLMGVQNKQRVYLRIDESKVTRESKESVTIHADVEDRICLQEHAFVIDDENNPGLVYTGSAYITIRMLAHPGSQQVFNLRVMDSNVRGTAVSLVFNGIVTETGNSYQPVNYKLKLNDDQDDSAIKMERRIEKSLDFMKRLEQGHTSERLSKIYTPVGPTNNKVRYAPISSIVTPLDATWQQVDDMCRVFLTFVFHGHQERLDEMIKCAERPGYRYCRMYELIAATVLQFFVRFTQYKTDVIIAEGPETYKKILFDIFPFASHEYNLGMILLKSGDCDDGACLFLSIAKTIGLNPFLEPTGPDKVGEVFNSNKYRHMDAIRKALNLRVATGAIVAASVSSASKMDEENLDGLAGHMCSFLVDIRAMTDALVNGLILRENVEQQSLNSTDVNQYSQQTREHAAVEDEGVRISVLSGLINPQAAGELVQGTIWATRDADYEALERFLSGIVDPPKKVLYIEGTATPSELHLEAEDAPLGEQWFRLLELAKKLQIKSAGNVDVRIGTMKKTGESTFVIAVAELVGLEVRPRVQHPKVPSSMREAHVVGPVYFDGNSFNIGLQKGVLSRDFSNNRFAAIPAIVGKATNKQKPSEDEVETDDELVDNKYQKSLEKFRPKGTTKETNDISTVMDDSVWENVQNNVNYIMDELHNYTHKDYNPNSANGDSVSFTVHFRQLLFFPEIGKRVVFYVKSVLEDQTKPYTCRVYKGVFPDMYQSEKSRGNVVQLFVVIQFSE